MDDLKEVMSEYQNTIELPSQITEDFPDTYNYTGRTLCKISNYYFGMGFGYSSTGARLSYADYSGSFNFDIISSSYQIVPIIGYNVFSRNGFDINLDLSVPLLFSEVKFNDYLQLYNEEPNTNTFKANSESIALLPGVNIKYYLKFLYVALEAAYLVDSQGVLHSPSDRKAYLQDASNNKITTDWSGFRIQILVGFRVFTIKN
jgi:hypothetical protein